MARARSVILGWWEARGEAISVRVVPWGRPAARSPLLRAPPPSRPRA